MTSKEVLFCGKRPFEKQSPITSFEGEYAFLSNFFPCRVFWVGYWFPSSENAYQWSKIEPLNITPKLHDDFINCSAAKAKKLGKLVPLRKDWEETKIKIMENILISKFTHNPILKQQLLATGNVELIEGNTWNDTFWGQCPVGSGKNMLGKLLMSIRNKFQLENKLV